MAIGTSYREQRACVFGYAKLAGATGLAPATFGGTGRSKFNVINGRCNVSGGPKRPKRRGSCNRPSGPPPALTRPPPSPPFADALAPAPGGLAPCPSPRYPFARPQENENFRSGCAVDLIKWIKSLRP